MIYLGRCNASIDAGINPDCISTVHNAFIIRRVDNDLFIAGTDEGGSSDNFAVDAGTLFGVYEFLGSELGVRWLWPGTIGEYVPQCSTITIGHCDTVFIPQLLHSWLRSASYSYSGWSDPNNRDYFINAQTEWMRRHQFNMAVSLQYPHGFMRTSETETYWDRYHTNHSDWFNLLPDDTREPDPYYENGNASGLIAHCVSSTGLQAQIVNNWIPDVVSDTPWINGTENDTGGKCMCNYCMALDVEPADFLSEYGITWSQRASSATTAFDNEEAGWEHWLGPMSDRYSNFLLSLLNEATYAGYPDAKVVGLAYVNYRHPPVAKDGKLNDNIIVGYVPDFYFPWTTAERDAAKNDWNGWRNTGCSLFYRPNYILSGHNFPIYYADKLIEDFVYCYDRGMIATDFDSLTGQFAVQAPTLYVLARIHTYASNKNKSVAEITTELLDEFYDSFGPAEPNVRDYFGYMKTVSDNVSSYSAAFSSWYTDACDIFTPSVMSTARIKINAAIAAASGNSDATAKVTFLKEGLDLVELTLAAQSEWEDYMNTGDLVGWQDSVDALDANRALVEDDFVSNMAFLATYEGNVWDRDIRGHDITAGELWPMQGDKIQDQNGAAFGDQDCFEVLPYYGTDNLCHMLIDFGVATNVDMIKLVNRKDVTTNYSPKHVHIYVASDESLPIFKSHHPGSYAIKVYDGDFLPAIIEANATRECDINNFNRRYFLLEVVSNFWGDINKQTNYALYFADIAASVDLFSDGFESNFDRWTDGGTTDWDRATSYKHSGSYSAHAGSADNDLISDNINTASYASMTITFWYRDDDIDADDDIYLQLYNGTGYISKFELDTVTEDTWYQYTVTIYNSGSDSQYFRSNFRIKFEGTSIDSGENLWIDDISIVTQY